MLRNATLTLFACLLLTAAASAAGPAAAQPAATAPDLARCSTAAPAQSEALPALGTPEPQPAASCYVSVDCGSTTVDCSGSTCYGVDRNCNTGEPGYVQCNGGSPEYCPECICHNYCEPCAAYGQTDDCGLTCVWNPNLPNCKRISAWVLAF